MKGRALLILAGAAGAMLVLRNMGKMAGAGAAPKAPTIPNNAPGAQSAGGLFGGSPGASGGKPGGGKSKGRTPGRSAGGFGKKRTASVPPNPAAPNHRAGKLHA